MGESDLLLGPHEQSIIASIGRTTQRRGGPPYAPPLCSPTPRSPTAKNRPKAGDYGVDCRPCTALVGKTLPVFGNSFPFSFHGTFLSHRRRYWPL
jgi:hypothetical protein